MLVNKNVSDSLMNKQKVHFHLPGLFEFYELYKIFISLFYEHNEFFYDWCDIGSIYGTPPDALWGGGRIECGQFGIEQNVLALSKEYGFSVRLAFSNSLLTQEHLKDKKCNLLCKTFLNEHNGIIIYSDLLLNYIKKNYPDYYFVSSTTKVITEINKFYKELDRAEFKYIVPDFRMNNQMDIVKSLPVDKRKKIEFLCNECCWPDCTRRKECYENVSSRVLDKQVVDWKCDSPYSNEGYVFSKAMKSSKFIGIDAIKNIYTKMGYYDFKLEGRSLGSALVLEILLYYMVKPEFQINVREKIYLSNTLDLF